MNEIYSYTRWTGESGPNILNIINRLCVKIVLRCRWNFPLGVWCFKSLKWISFWILALDVTENFAQRSETPQHKNMWRHPFKKPQNLMEKDAGIIKMFDLFCLFVDYMCQVWAIRFFLFLALPTPQYFLPVQSDPWFDSWAQSCQFLKWGKTKSDLFWVQNCISSSQIAFSDAWIHSFLLRKNNSFAGHESPPHRSGFFFTSAASFDHQQRRLQNVEQIVVKQRHSFDCVFVILSV